jgi:hypothetical protein
VEPCHLQESGWNWRTNVFSFICKNTQREREMTREKERERENLKADGNVTEKPTDLYNQFM